MGMYQFQNVKQVEPASPKAPDMELTAVKANGDIYQKRFYSNNKDLVRKFAQFGKGDWVELTFVGKYQNLDDVKEGKKPDTPQENQGGGFKKYPSNSNNNVRRSDGTSRGDDTNRSAALYFVKDLVTQWFDGQPAAEKKKISVSDMIDIAISESTRVFDYIAKGITPQSDDDPLAPPED